MKKVPLLIVSCMCLLAAWYAVCSYERDAIFEKSGCYSFGTAYLVYSDYVHDECFPTKAEAEEAQKAWNAIKIELDEKERGWTALRS